MCIPDRLFALALLASATAVTSGAAAETPAPDASTQGPFGNTVVLKREDGSIDKLYVEPDGSYVIAGADGVRRTGVWAARGAKVCFTQVEPALGPGGKPSCVENGTHLPGESWVSVDQDGRKTITSILPGR